jgi:hypothetical protein
MARCYSAERRQSLIDVIEEGAAGGEFPADVDAELAALALLGAVFYGRLMAAEPFEPARARPSPRTRQRRPATSPAERRRRP